MNLFDRRGGAPRAPTRPFTAKTISWPHTPGRVGLTGGRSSRARSPDENALPTQDRVSTFIW